MTEIFRLRISSLLLSNIIQFSHNSLILLVLLWRNKNRVFKFHNEAIMVKEHPEARLFLY